ncbi:MAG: glycosyltransferase [Caulobacteraceae bacterium]|nr:glycosyltransferase [Caulobacteraceae bacterium]
MKVYVLPAHEDWVVDRFVKEWAESNSDITTFVPEEADVIWILAGWCWRKLSPALLSKKKVVVTVHHVVPEKFDNLKLADFIERDKFVTAYHVYNQVTYDFVRSISKKPIQILQYWANQDVWKKTSDKTTLRNKYRLPLRAYIVGSFQRDTEGFDLKTPKLEKGPDLFADYVTKLHNKLGGHNLHVVLAGWRRQYVISRLKENSVNFSYFELPDQHTLNELYQTLDLYPVTARYEGGPQALIECGLLDVPVVSRNVGIAPYVLPSESINDDVELAVPNVPSVELLKIPASFQRYRRFLETLP